MNINRLHHICKQHYQTGKRCNHFAFVMRKNRIVSFGINRPFKTHPQAVKYRFHAIHAEIDAILGIPYQYLKRPSKLKLVSLRLHPDFTLGMAKPCCLCARYIKQYGIRKVIYSTKNGTVKSY